MKKPSIGAIIGIASGAVAIILGGLTAHSMGYFPVTDNGMQEHSDDAERSRAEIMILILYDKLDVLYGNMEILNIRINNEPENIDLVSQRAKLETRILRTEHQLEKAEKETE